MYHLRESGLNRKIKNDREKESPRLMHVIVLHFTLYLFWGAALVSEWGVLALWERPRAGTRP